MKHLFWLHTCASLSGYGGEYAHTLGEHVKYLLCSQGRLKPPTGLELFISHMKKVTRPCSPSLFMAVLGSHSSSGAQISLCSCLYCTARSPSTRRNVSILPAFTGARSNCLPRERAHFLRLLLLLALARARRLAKPESLPYAIPFLKRLLPSTLSVRVEKNFNKPLGADIK